MISIITELRVASRNLKRTRSRTAVAVLTVACGLMAYLLAGGFIEWIFHGMRETTIRSQLGHIQVVKPGYLEKGIADPYDFLLAPHSEELLKIKQHPDVVSVAERLVFSGLASFGDTTVTFTGEGIDPQREAVISDAIFLRSGNNLVSTDQRAIILGEGLAKNLGVKPGDSIILLATSANGVPNAIEVNVSGIFYTSSKEFDDTALRLPIDLARKLMRVNGATLWVVLLENTNLTKQVVADLRATLPHAKLEVIPWSDLADFYNKTVVLFGKQVSFMKMIIAMIIILTISNIQTMSVLERTTEIGTMMALGSRRASVLRMFIFEGLMIGVLGGLVGLAVGYGIAELVSTIGIPMPPPPGMEVGLTGQILVTTELALDALGLAFMTTLAASVIPAWKASRLNIVDALRCNQ